MSNNVITHSSLVDILHLGMQPSIGVYHQLLWHVCIARSVVPLVGQV